MTDAPSLAEIQASLIEFLTKKSPPEPSFEYIDGSRFSASFRLGFLKRDARRRFREFIQRTFTDTLELFELQTADQLVNRFIDQHPCADDDMLDWMSEFPPYLHSVEAANDFPFVSDLARLELATHEVTFMRANCSYDGSQARNVNPFRAELLSWSLLTRQSQYRGFDKGKRPERRKQLVVACHDGLQVCIGTITRAEAAWVHSQWPKMLSHEISAWVGKTAPGPPRQTQARLIQIGFLERPIVQDPR